MDEVIVLDVRESAKLLLEEVQRGGAEIQEGLDGDLLSPLAVEGLVNDAHATVAQAANDFVPRRPAPLGRARGGAHSARGTDRPVSHSLAALACLGSNNPQAYQG